MQGEKAYKEIQRSYQGILKGAQKDLKKVEKELQETLAVNKELQHLHQIITSVDEVGTTTAIYLISLTDDFKTLNNPRKLAWYAGVAPFQHSSGTSVRGKERVSAFADKELKTLLHLCAVSVLKMKNGFTDFVKQKKEEGETYDVDTQFTKKQNITRNMCLCAQKCNV